MTNVDVCLSRGSKHCNGTMEVASCGCGDAATGLFSASARSQSLVALDLHVACFVALARRIRSELNLCLWEVRPSSLGEPPGPAVRVGRGQQPGTIVQPSLDVPVLQMVDQKLKMKK